MNFFRGFTDWVLSAVQPRCGRIVVETCMSPNSRTDKGLSAV